LFLNITNKNKNKNFFFWKKPLAYFPAVEPHIDDASYVEDEPVTSTLFPFTENCKKGVEWGEHNPQLLLVLIASNLQVSLERRIFRHVDGNGFQQNSSTHKTRIVCTQGQGTLHLKKCFVCKGNLAQGRSSIQWCRLAQSIHSNGPEESLQVQQCAWGTPKAARLPTNNTNTKSIEKLLFYRTKKKVNRSFAQLVLALLNQNYIQKKNEEWKKENTDTQLHKTQHLKDHT
jgi:hypothetical protein